MKKFEVNRLRDIGIFAHLGAGKTSLVEAILYNCKAIERLGRVDEGNATCDYEFEEIRRKMSISAALAPCVWKEHRLNLIDAPGYADFVGEVLGAMRVVDGSIIVVDASAGVEVGTEAVWRYADEHGLPRIIFINKMDRENANFFRSLENLREAFGNKLVPVQLPIGAEAAFAGVVDLIAQKGLYFKDDLTGTYETKEIPEDIAKEMPKYREKLIEAAAEAEDELIGKYLEGEELTPEEINRGLRLGTSKGNIIPVFCGSAYKNIAIQPLMDALVNYLPSPADLGEIKGINPKTNQEESRKPQETESFSAFVFKTITDPYIGKLSFLKVYSGVLKSDSSVYNSSKDELERVGQIYIPCGKRQDPVAELGPGELGAVPKLEVTTTGDTLCDRARPILFKSIEFPRPVFSVAVLPKTKEDQDKLSTVVSRLAEEDPSFEVLRATETRQTLLSGRGETHVEVMVERLKRKFGVNVDIETPKVPYKETIRKTVTAEYRHRKQTGGHGQYGHVFLRLEPKERGTGFEFADEVVGGAIPKQYIPAVEKGVRQALEEGVLADYPVVDVKVTVYDGTYHPVDSSEISFKLAALHAFKKGAREANPVLLEPIMDVEITVPERFMGDIIGDLNGRRGRVLGMERRGDNQVIKAQVPLAEMLRYAVSLNSITGGRGSFTMKEAYYEEVPEYIAEKIIAQAKKEEK